jgi:hypothetical protein
LPFRLETTGSWMVVLSRSYRLRFLDKASPSVNPHLSSALTIASAL